MKNKILSTKKIDWKNLIPVQPDNFKHFTDEQINKLKLSLKNNGFSTPFAVWQNKNKMLNSLDGANRIEKTIESDSYSDDLINMLKSAFLNVKNNMDDKCSFYVCSAQGGDMMMMIDCHIQV